MTAILNTQWQVLVDTSIESPNIQYNAPASTAASETAEKQAAGICKGTRLHLK